MRALTFISSGIVRTALFWSGRILLVSYFAAGLLILAGRYVLMPELAGQRELVEQKLSTALGLPVKIAALSAEWPGLNPLLRIEGLQIHDSQNRPTLAFERVDAEIGWSSLLYFELRLHRLEILAPALDIRRDVDGALFVAGLPVKNDGNSDFANWLLKQSRIVVRDARVTWHDELRAAPPLELQHVNFDLRNFLRRHSFGLTGEPVAATEVPTPASRLDLRGNLVGSDPADLAGWHGDLYAELGKADLSAWRPWIDLPLESTRGRGNARLWLSFANRLPVSLTADLQLSDVSLRLRPDLPELVLTRLDGRLTGRHEDDTYSGEIKRLVMETQEGEVSPPTELRLKFIPEGRKAGGEFFAGELDLGALAALANHLPLPSQVHERLREFSPRGRLSGFEVKWDGMPEAMTHWRVKGRGEALALAAHGNVPGFSGISGSVSGDDKSGEVKLDSKEARIDLPAVFPEPVIALDRLEVEAGWRERPGGMEIDLSRANFQNADASGEATGSYRLGDKGLGEIDLSAKLTHAHGDAVWRYMPLVVNQDARDWLRFSIKGGRADSVTLRLKGPLDKFPFRDGKGGIFQVKGNFQSATLQYAQGWPEITAIDGSLLFEGVRMQIRGQRANIMGVALGDVLAEIADLDLPEELLVVTGKAKGDTQKFLDFIEASPVGERIEHFTQPMAAAGSGSLDLRLDLPLRHIVDSQVKGNYKFADNQVRVLPELPPLTAAQGEFGFTSDRLQAKGLRARLYGSPLSVDVTSAPGGTVRVDAKGSLAAQGLLQQFGQRPLEHLSGVAQWRGTVTVKKPAAEVRIESNLEGLASSLPDPFNKSAGTSLPLVVAGRIESDRDAWTLMLGKVAAIRLQQAGTAWRGRAALGDAVQMPAAALPERGIALAISQPKLNLDVWRALLSGSEQADTSNTALSLAALDIRSNTLRLMSRDFHDVHVAGTQADGHWRFNVEAREARGQLNWDGTGAGRIGGRLASLTIPAAEQDGEPSEDAQADATRKMPAVDLVIDDFRLRDMALGAVRVDAENRAGLWQAQLDVKNEAAHLTGTGRWRPSPSAPSTALSFRLDVSDAEKLLGRMGMPDAVRRGSGWIEGDLNWAGSPFGFDLPTLSGQLKTDVGKGQFKKLEPGVGRLLGVLSLQSLPRRITLDFRDIFSEGFAFDSIVGEAGVKRGVMHTDELKIRGPAAKILLSGKVDLTAETQDLKVRVQPALGESVAVGAMLAHPVAGAVAWAAQKLLNDPLDQVFAYEYAVTGGWSDPKVDKLKRPPPPGGAAQ